jgi:hypothetical protein
LHDQSIERQVALRISAACSSLVFEEGVPPPKVQGTMGAGSYRHNDACSSCAIDKVSDALSAM